MDIIKTIERDQIKKDIPEFRVGDTIKVNYKIVEGGKERIQVVEGVVIERKNSGLKESFTVRRVTHGVGVERSFLLHSPRVEKIVVVKKGDVRKARLYYLREKIGKATKIKEK